MDEKNNALEVLLDNESVDDFDSEPVIENEPEPQKRAFNISEIVFAWASIIFGYAFCRTVPVYLNPLGSVLLIAAMFAVAGIIIKLNSGKLSGNAIFAAASAVVANLSLILTANQAIHTLTFFFFIFAFTYFVYTCFGNDLDGKFSNLLIVDLFKSTFVMPFASFGKVFVAMFSKGNKKVGNSIVKILVGLVIAIVPTIVIVSLLSFDKDFSNLIENIFAFDLSISAGRIGSLILGVPIGMYIFGLYLSSADKKCQSLNKESCDNSRQKAKFLPCITACTAVLPILVVYILYFVSQFKYFCSAFVNVLPENFSYAEYARAGFFQLLTVTIINAIIIVALLMFSKRNTKFEIIALKTVTILFCVATLVLVCSALSKMLMYIDIYGLTPKRIYTSWFMVMISLVVVTVIIKQLVSKFKIVPIACIACTMMIAVLSLARVDAFIAKYNVDRYVNNTAVSVDIELLDSLSDDSVEQMVRLKKYIESTPDGKNTILYKSLDEKLETKAKTIDNEDFGVLDFSLPHYKAKKALTDAGYIE